MGAKGGDEGVRGRGRVWECSGVQECGRVGGVEGKGCGRIGVW